MSKLKTKAQRYYNKELVAASAERKYGDDVVWYMQTNSFTTTDGDVICLKSIREVADALELSQSTAFNAITGLIEAGRIAKGKKRACYEVKQLL